MEPNTTQTPNFLFDSLLKEPLSLAELKITLAVIRHTYGWGETNWEMSISDLCQITGLTRANVQRGASRLVMGSDRLPPILGRKQNKSGVYVYWLLIDKKSVPSAVADGSKDAGGVIATITGVLSQRGQQVLSQHGHPKEERKTCKPKSVKSSSSVPPRAQESQTDDDDSNWNSGGSHRQKAIWLFNSLSNGTAWRETRDGSDYEKIAHLSWRIIAMGMCYTVSKLSAHRMGSLKVALDQIQSHAKEMSTYAQSDLDRIVRPVFQRTRRCMRLGKWDLSEMTKAEQDEVLRRDRKEFRKAG